MRCAACDLVFYPRVSPAIIVLVRRGDQALLARAARTTSGFYSTLAGFVEPGESLEQTRETIEKVRAEAARHGREVKFSVSFRPIVAATEEAAWAKADDILQRARERLERSGAVLPNKPESVGAQRLRETVAKGERVDKRLWTGIAKVVGGAHNSTALVGTPEQVAEAFLDYYDLGVTTFLIRGFDPLEDAIDYGRELLPLTRAKVAERQKQAAA